VSSGAIAGGLFAGCTDQLSGDTDQSASKVTIGSTVPLSGPYSAAGQSIINLLELAGDQAIQKNEISDFELLVQDSNSDPAEARKVTQSQLDKGADFFITALLSTSQVAVADVLKDEDLVFKISPGYPDFDLDQCVPNMFKFTRAMPGWLQGSLGYAAKENMGTTTYTIYSDVKQMNEMNSYLENTFKDEYGLEPVGSKAVPFGQSDYSQSLTAAKESGADIINLFMFGADVINSLKQASEFGLNDGSRVISAPTVDYRLGGAIKPDMLSYEKSLFGLVGGYHIIDNQANNEFTELYREKYDEYPTFHPWYQAARTLLNAVSEVGTKDTDPVRNELEGKKLLPQLFGSNEKYRECDHRMNIPAVTMKGKSSVDKEKQDFFNIVNINGNTGEIMFPCNRIACSD